MNRNGNLSIQSVENMLQVARQGHQLLDPQAQYAEQQWRGADNVTIEREAPLETDAEPSGRLV